MRIDRLLSGYVTFSVAPADIKKAATALLRANLCASFNDKGEFDIGILAVKKYEKALCGISYSKSELKGLFGFLRKNRKRYGVFAALILLSVYYLLVYDLVWDIRVEENEEVSASVVCAELSSAGIDIGSRWHKISKSEVERSLLENSEKIGWININRRGNVAYITVKGKSESDKNEEPSGYSNIVASCDCVIEEITVKRGIACVKAGDTVKKGQLLISGVIPAELGGGFVRAEGEIFGRVSEDISVFVPKEETSVIYGEEKLTEARIKIFNFYINIFKSYGNKDKACAIIEEREEFVILGCRIPIGIYRSYSENFQNELTVHDDAELVKVASYRLRKLMEIKLSDAELLRMKTYGEFKNGGYEMHSSVAVLRNICEERRFY